MSPKRPGLGQRRTPRYQRDFVGRRPYLQFFEQNLQLAPDDERFRNVLNIHGPGGMGKTWLLLTFRDLAGQAHEPVALVGDEVDTLPEAMDSIARQFAEQGAALERFSQRYQIYRRHMATVSADPHAPPGFALGPATGRRASPAQRLSPLATPAPGTLTPEQIAGLIDPVTGYLSGIVEHADDVELLADPVNRLSRLFADDLMNWPEIQRPVLLFDTYERTAAFLDRWLRDLLAEVYGPVPQDITVVVAGRYQLGKDPARPSAEQGEDPWRDYADLVQWMPLEPLSQDEVRELLERRGIEDDARLAAVQEATGGYPMLLDLALQAETGDGQGSTDPHTLLVERTLRWIDDESQRRAALAAALPRNLDQDILEKLVPGTDAAGLLSWLETLSFVGGPPGRLRYARIVRESMLSYQRLRSPEGWRRAHQSLAAHFQAAQEPLGLSRSQGARDESWQALALEALYHKLCARPGDQLTPAVEGFLLAADEQQRFARRWAATMTQAGEDGDDETLRQWGQRLEAALYAADEAGALAGVETLTELVNRFRLEAEPLGVSYAWRGRLNGRLGRHALAVEDMSAALAWRDHAQYWTELAAARLDLRDFQAAVEDLGQALQRDPHSERALGLRGSAYLLLGRFDEADRDLSRALLARPQDPHLHFVRSQARIRLGRFDEGLADMDWAKSLGHPDPELLRSARVYALSLQGNYPEALDLADQALAQDPDNLSMLAMKIGIYQKMGNLAQMATTYGLLVSRFSSFLTELRAVYENAPPGMLEREVEQWASNRDLDPSAGRRFMAMLREMLDAGPERVQEIVQADWLNVQAAQRLQALQFAAALDLANQALALDEKPNYRLTRALAQIYLSHPAEALADLDRALALDPDLAMTRIVRAEFLTLQGLQDEAVSEYDRLLLQIPDNGALLWARGQVHYILKDLAGAKEDWGRIIELELPQKARALAACAEVLAEEGDFEQALADVALAAQLEPDNPSIAGSRNTILRRMGDFEALRIGLEASSERVARFVRQYFQRMEAGEESLAIQGVSQWVLSMGTPSLVQPAILISTVQELNTDPDAAVRNMQAAVYAMNAELHRQLEQWEPMLESLDRALELQPDEPGFWQGRAEAHRRLQRPDLAEADLDRVLQLSPDETGALAARAALRRSRERFAEAQADYDRLVALLPGDPLPLNERGEAWRLAGRYDQALADFDAVLAIDPANLPALSNRAETFAAQERYAEAIDDLTAALALRPDYGWALGQRAEACRFSGRFDEALADYERLLALRPDEVAVHFGRGETFRLLGRLPEALADFSQVIETMPAHFAAWAGRGAAHATIGALAEGLADLDQALELVPDYLFALDWRSNILLVQGRAAEAIETLDRALASSPDNPAFLVRRGGIHRSLGHEEAAARDLDRAIDLEDGDDWHWYERGLLRLAQGRTAEGQADLATALRLAETRLAADPGVAIQAMNLALYCLATGDKPRAIQLYQATLAGQVAPITLLAARHDLENLMAAMPGLNASRVQALFERHASE